MAEPFDVVVVGAGIHGAGVAQAAAAAGQRVLVLEQHAPAYGTSSRSSKLIHGGLRYLEGAHFSLVRAALHERRLLLQLAPELVHLTPFHIPVYRNMRRGPATIRLGLMLYALLGNLQPAAMFRSLPRRDWTQLDGLSTENLRAVFRYYDAQTDDAALTRAVLQSARGLGVEVQYPAHFIGAERGAGFYRVRYDSAGQVHECDARALVNAAGAWVNAVAQRVTPIPATLPLELIQGTHVLIRGRLDAGCYYLEAADGRAVFALPSTSTPGILIGTTETPYRGDPAMVQPLNAEVEYLAQTYRRYFPTRDYEPLNRFAGVRVLPQADTAAFNRPRETRFVIDVAKPAYAAIYGGKLTTYRTTAAQLVQTIAPALPRRTARGRTDRLRLTPAD